MGRIIPPRLGKERNHFFMSIFRVASKTTAAPEKHIYAQPFFLVASDNTVAPEKTRCHSGQGTMLLDRCGILQKIGNRNILSK